MHNFIIFNKVNSLTRSNKIHSFCFYQFTVHCSYQKYKYKHAPRSKLIAFQSVRQQNMIARKLESILIPPHNDVRDQKSDHRSMFDIPFS